MANSILVPTDLSDLALAGIELGITLALSMEAELHILYVLDTRGDSTDPLPGSYEVDSKHWLDQMHRQIKTAAARLPLSPMGTLKTSVRTSFGIPWTEIAAVADGMEASLVCMATHGRTGLHNLVMGSIAERVCRYVHRPVMTIRNGGHAVLEYAHAGTDNLGLSRVSNWAPRRILVASDLTPPSVPAVAEAGRLAARLGATLAVLHVMDLGRSGLSLLADSGMAVNPQDKLVDHGLALMEAFFETHAPNLPIESVRAERCIRVGDPFREIISGARDESADIIVMGRHSKEEIRAIFMGSVAERVIRTATVPVMTVPHLSPLNNSASALESR